jgi:type IV pilus assembly protein PilA
MSQRGFSLTELLIAMAAMMALTAIAVPHLLRARMSANEAAAVGNVHVLQDAQLMYSISHPDQGYSCSLNELGPSPNGRGPSASNADLIDSQLTTGKKSGYLYEIGGCEESLPRSAYTITAVPESNGTTGKLNFCARQDGAISYAADSALGCLAHGIPLQQKGGWGNGSDLATASTPASN